jgi:hypothetical protein
VRVLVGTDDGLHQAGAAADAATALPGASVTALARAGKAWWAVAEGYRILASEDARTWTEAAALKGLRAECVLAFDGGALAGTSEAHLVRVADGRSERVRSFDRVPTRDSWYTPWGGPPDTRSLASGAEGAAYANVHVGGILRSDDGRSWRATPMDVDADVHEVLAHPTIPGLVFAATAIGLATSRDGGATWTFEDEGLHAAYCRAVAIAGDTLLLSASAGHTGRRAALYRRALAGGTFERCGAGLPEWFADNVDTGCLDARGEHAALGTSDGRVFVSTDAGASWEEMQTEGRPVGCLRLA